MDIWNKISPYFSLGIATIIVFIIAQMPIEEKYQNILMGVFSNKFSFLLYIF